MTEPEYTLDELADITGVKPRTIRHYIQQDLLLGPASLGRNATYREYHRKRLDVIKTLRSHHLSIDEIRKYFALARPDEDIELATIPVDLSARRRGPRSRSDETLDFIRSRQAGRRPADDDGDPAVNGDVAHALARPDTVYEPAPAYADAAAPPTTSGPIELLLEQLRTLAADQRVARRTRGEEWVRFAATPDLEIHVRGQLPPEQLLLFEQITDHIRHILLGGDRHA